MTYVGYFFTALLLSLGLNFLLSIFVFKNKSTELKRLGGSVVIFVFCLSALNNKELVLTNSIQALIFGSLAILIFGVFDDFKKFSWKLQLVFQLVLALFLVFSGFQIEYISNPLGGIIDFSFWKWQLAGIIIFPLGALLSVLWIIVCINAVNWADGLDGLAGGITLIGALSIFWISLYPHVNQPALAILALILVGSVAGFWILNFPPAKIIAGSSGSYFFGFMIAVLAILSGTKIATAMIAMTLPLVDFLAVIVTRKIDGRPIFLGEREDRHFHFILKKLGFSNWLILACYLGFLLLMFLTIVFFTQDRNEKIIWLGIEFILALLIIVFAYRYKQKNIDQKGFFG